MNSFFGQVRAIVWKDFLTEFKTRELFSSMFVFAVLVILIFIFSVDLSLVNSEEVGPGVLWVAVIFAGTLGLNRSFTLEKENSGLQGLLLAPIDRAAIYFGKMLSNLIFFLVMEAFILWKKSIPLFARMSWEIIKNMVLDAWQSSGKRRTNILAFPALNISLNLMSLI